MLWGDNLWETSDAFKMLFPKAYGTWERCWNAHPVWEHSQNPEDSLFMDDFVRFYTIVRLRELPELERSGLDYWKENQ